MWDVLYCHGNPICVQSQQGHLFSLKKWKEEYGKSRFLSYVYFIFIAHVDILFCHLQSTHVLFNNPSQLTKLLSYRINAQTEYRCLQYWLNYHTLYCVYGPDHFNYPLGSSGVLLASSIVTPSARLHASVEHEWMNKGWCLDSPWWRLSLSEHNVSQIPYLLWRQLYELYCHQQFRCKVDTIPCKGQLCEIIICRFIFFFFFYLLRRNVL